MHLKYNKKENEMSMFVKKRQHDWIIDKLAYLDLWSRANMIVRDARRDVKSAREEITVHLERSDEGHPEKVCFVYSKKIVLPWQTKSHPAEDSEFTAVCSIAGRDGICPQKHQCALGKDRKNYEQAVENLKVQKAWRLKWIRGFFGMKK